MKRRHGATEGASPRPDRRRRLDRVRANSLQTVAFLTAPMPFPDLDAPDPNP